MNSVLDRSALEQSPLADLHLIANELGVDGFRRLRKADLVDAILAKQGGEETAAATEEPTEDEAPRRQRRSRRGGRGRSRDRDEEAEEGATDEGAGDDEEEAEPEPEPEREAEAPRKGRSRSRERGDRDREREPEAEDRAAEGVVELLPNGSGFVRLSHPEQTDDDVYISAAQVKRCELVSGDRVGGPVRAPRRSERFPSMIRIDTINGRPADEVAEGTRFEDLPVAWPAERLEFGSDDPTVQAIEWLTPIGKGSRAVIAGAPRAGKTEALRRLAGALSGREGIELTVVLTGVRPEEIGDWRAAGTEPVATLSFAASPDAQAQALEQAIEQGRRVAARGGDAVVLIDALDYVSPAAARRVLAAARNIEGGGSLTVIATAPAPLGGETTVVSLHAGLTSLGRFPALDLAVSGTLRAELLVGDAGADAIAKARAEQTAA